ncbi:putative hydrolase [Helianthus annuus]|nr:putative hydrolase [Helianthus annuus]
MAPENQLPGKPLIIWDFDRTIMDDDSDRWVVVEMGLTQLFNQLRQTLPWNSLMDRMMEELHSQGKTIEDITNCLNRVVLNPQIISAIRAAHAHGYLLHLLSCFIICICVLIQDFFLMGSNFFSVFKIFITKR